MIKYIFVTGGVVSGLGKGITAASLGMMLKAKGLRVIAQKLDPYINIDPGNMSPLQHGEVFVTEDGAETDLDVGHYERFIDVNLNKFSNITSGKVYLKVFENQRNGVYGGETVQVIPHITNEIKKFIYSVGKKIDADVVITEIGGTTGDIESLPYLEAIRQVAIEVGRENCLFVHVTLAPVVSESEGIKTKPTQHSVKMLRTTGIQPNIIVLRCNGKIDDSAREKISMFCSVPQDCVIANTDVKLLYEVPLMLEKSNFAQIVSRELGLPDNPPDFLQWNKMLEKAHRREKSVKIGLIGKYVAMYDAYLSLSEALTHAGIENDVKIDIKWIDSESINDANAESVLKDTDAVIVPGAFGEKGLEGMIAAAKYCRIKNLPYFGICLGMQALVLEYARNKANIEAYSREFTPNAVHKVVDIMDSQVGFEGKDGMRMGAYECKIKSGTKLHRAYGADTIMERHRNRYEVNNAYLDQLTDAGLIISGVNPETELIEAVELKENLFHLGVQYNPEFKSRPHRPHPLFVAFIAAAKK